MQVDKKINDNNYLKPHLCIFLLLFASYGIPMCASVGAPYRKLFVVP